MSNNFNMSFDVTTRQQFADVLSDYGLTVPQAFKLFANQVIKTGKVPLSFDWADTMQSHKLSENGERLLRESIAEFEGGEYTRSSFDDFAKWAKENA